MSKESDLLERYPAGGSIGRKAVVQNTLAAALQVKGSIQEANANKELASLGRAKVLASFAKGTAFVELLKARRQLAHGQALLDGKRAALRAKAIGQPLATDPNWADRLWAMAPNARAEYLLRNPKARSAALREPELCGVDANMYEHILRKQVQEFHEKSGAEIAIDEQAQELQRIAVGELEKEVMALPIVTTDNEAFSFNSRQHLDKYIETVLPGASSREITPQERNEIAA